METITMYNLIIQKRINTIKTASLFLLLVIGLSACSDKPEKVQPIQEKATSVTTTSVEADYDFDNWSKSAISVKGMNVADINHVINQPLSKKKTLDYHGDEATKHVYINDAIEFFNIIDSKNLLELNWFMATIEDESATKVASKKIALMAHKAARVALQDKGGQIVKQIMTNPDMSASSDEKRIIYAKCEVFFCRLVIVKSGQAITTEPSDNSAG